MFLYCELYNNEDASIFPFYARETSLSLFFTYSLNLVPLKNIEMKSKANSYNTSNHKEYTKMENSENET